MVQQRVLKLHAGMLIFAVLCLMFALSITADAAEYTRYGALVSVADGPSQTLSTVRVSVKAGELRGGDTVFITLPKDFRFNGGDWSSGEDGANKYYGDYDQGCSIYVPWNETNGLNMAVDATSGDPMATDIFIVDQIQDNEIKLQVNNIPDYPSISEDGYFLIYLKDVDIPTDFRGAIALSFDAPPGSGFGDGEVSGGRVGRLDSEDDNGDVSDPEEEGQEELDPSDIPPEEEEAEEGKGPGAVFVLGKAVYTLGDDEINMDVAPYAKEGRTYLPMRFVAQALGIEGSNILWNKGTATFIVGEKRVSVTIGSNVMYIDSAAVIIDAAPEIAHGRTMLPVKWIAAAFGVDAVWDSASQRVTVK